MHYLIYKIKNIISGKIYIGAHVTNDKNDSYMGSGVHVKRAIKKHGRHNFTKEILFELTSSEEMYAKEAEIVNEHFVKRDDTYNVALGGKGSPYGGKIPEATKTLISKSVSIAMNNPETKRKCSLAKIGHTQSSETRQKRSITMKEKLKGRIIVKGPMSSEQKAKISASSKGKKKVEWDVYINGTHYDSIEDAAIANRVTGKSIYNWTKDPSKSGCYKTKKES
ncbi:homing endonuclease [Tegunavirus sp. BRC001]